MTAPSMWNPTQYERFRQERRQPFLDLMAMVRPRPGMRVLDVGCGTGELTALLHAELGARETLGIDSSETMLAESARFATSSLRFAQADMRVFEDDRPFDLAFSNAALQWADGQEDVLRRLTGLLEDAGQLAVQVPANHDHPSHTVAAAVVAEEPFRSATGGYERGTPVLEPQEYALLLHRLGFREQLVRLQVYAHTLPSRDEVIEWVKGTLLVDYRRRMSEDLYAQFLDRYRDRLLPCLDDARPYFYPFKRILFWAQR